MISVLFALLAAASNALASVLQRRAARSAPEEFAFRPALLWSLIRRPVWLGGIGALIAGFLLQASALANGGLALVQPLLVAEFGEGMTTLLSSWQPYAMVVAGIGSVFLLQNALQSGTLVAAQPALTICDPVASVLYGITMFGERVRSGIWLVLEVAGFALILYGSMRLSRSRPIQMQAETETV